MRFVFIFFKFYIFKVYNVIIYISVYMCMHTYNEIITIIE